MDPTASDRSFARVVAASYEDPAREPPRADAEVLRDALFLLTSDDEDAREMGLYVLSRGSPALIARLYPRMRGDERALDEIARLVHAEVGLIERSDEAWKAFDRALRELPALRDELPDRVRDEIASRRRWADAVFSALDPADADDLHRRVTRVERNTLVGAYPKPR